MSEDAATQTSLVARAAAGDETAVAHLYDLYAPPLYAFGMRRLADAELAEQLVQDVMTRLWRSAGRFDASRASVRTWIFAIARSVAVDLHRGRGRRMRAIVVDRDVLDRADEVGAELDGLIRAESVRAALDRLSREHREVLELAYFAGMRQSDIAHRLALPLGTVKSRTYYALRAFGLACDELGVER